MSKTAEQHDSVGGSKPCSRHEIERGRDRFVCAAVGLAGVHLVVVSLTIGVRGEHLLADLLLVGLALAGTRHRKARSSALALLPLWFTAAVYEGLRLLLPFRGRVHVADLHAAELRWFGVEGSEGAVVTLATALQTRTHSVLDALCGAAYIVYLFVPIALILVWVWRGDGLRAYRLSWAFLAVNFAGFATQILWPAAPPWYVDQYGLGPAVLDAVPSAAGASRFDALFGTSYFAAFYSRNVNVFGAMPSLHVAYPVLAALACSRLGPRWSLPATTFALLVGFSALYLNHHYLLDVLAGAVYAGAAYGAVSTVQGRLAASRTQR